MERDKTDIEWTEKKAEIQIKIAELGLSEEYDSEIIHAALMEYLSDSLNTGLKDKYRENTRGNGIPNGGEKTIQMDAETTERLREVLMETARQLDLSDDPYEALDLFIHLTEREFEVEIFEGDTALEVRQVDDGW